jgi:hypothetical protein
MRPNPFWLLALVVACNCRTPLAVPPAPIPVYTGDAGDDCARACAAATSCGCPWATSDAGDGCVVGCRRDQAQGSASQLAPACLAAANDCGALKACAGVTACP